MCPDPQLISIYVDGELPSPWKEKMEAHLAECSACTEKFKKFRHLQEMFRKKANQSRTYTENNETIQSSAAEKTPPEQEFIESAKENVWRKMESRRRYGRRGVWRYRLSIPLPAAAAAAAIVLTILTIMYIRSVNLQPQDSSVKSNFILASEEEEMPNVIPAAQDMNGLLQLLGSDGTDVLILRLPESRNFSRSGEPAIIRAADYSRRYP